MTLIKISSSEKEVHEQICATFDLKVRFFTQENNPELLTMEVDTDSPAIAYHLAKAVCIRIQMLDVLNK